LLYRPEAFEPLTDEPWDEERVRAAVREIVSDTDEALRGPKLLWPAHDWDGWQAAKPMKNLYVGAAGVLLALDELRRRGHAETRLELADLGHRNIELFRARPDYVKGEEQPELRASSLLCARRGSPSWPGASLLTAPSPKTSTRSSARTSRTTPTR
jgi:hypothetical protein